MDMAAALDVRSSYHRSEGVAGVAVRMGLESNRAHHCHHRYHGRSMWCYPGRQLPLVWLGQMCPRRIRCRLRHMPH